MQFPKVQALATETMESKMATMKSPQDLENAIISLSQELFNIDLSTTKIRIQSPRKQRSDDLQSRSSSTNSSRKSRYSRGSINGVFNPPEPSKRRVASFPSDSIFSTSGEERERSRYEPRSLTSSYQRSSSHRKTVTISSSSDLQPSKSNPKLRNLSISSDKSNDWKDSEDVSKDTSDDDAMTSASSMKSSRGPLTVSSQKFSEMDSSSSPAKARTRVSMNLDTPRSEPQLATDEMFPLIPEPHRSALEIVSFVTPHILPPRKPISKKRRDEERKWIGNLVRSQLVVLYRLKANYQRKVNWEELIARMCLQRRPREIDGHAWEIVDRVRAFCAFLDVTWDKKSIRSGISLIARALESNMSQLDSDT